jgi:hypothetical protein
MKHALYKKKKRIETEREREREREIISKIEGGETFMT